MGTCFLKSHHGSVVRTQHTRPVDYNIIQSLYVWFTLSVENDEPTMRKNRYIYMPRAMTCDLTYLSDMTYTFARQPSDRCPSPN